MKGSSRWAARSAALVIVALQNACGGNSSGAMESAVLAAQAASQQPAKPVAATAADATDDAVSAALAAAAKALATGSKAPTRSAGLGTTPAAGTGPAPSTSYSAPINIAKGGIYTGNWESENPAQPAIVIATTEPVTIQNCNIRSVGVGIRSLMNGTTITVRNCKVQNLTPNVAGQSAERFIALFMPKSLTIENNEIKGGLGIYVDGGGRGAELIQVRYNKQSNLDGRKSDGMGAYQASFNVAQFLQLNNVQGIALGDISWNEVINAPYRSRVEDNINLYLTRGLPGRPFSIENNYIQGAYPAHPQTEGFSGGGIIVDGASKTAATASAYISITNNQVVSTSNYGIAISSGINSEIRNNRVVSNGLLSTGDRIVSANVGIYIWDINKNIAAGSFFGNAASGNNIAWIDKTGARNDSWLPNCASGACFSNSALTLSASLLKTNENTGSGSAPSMLEGAEYATWKSKVASAGIVIGIK